MYRVVISTKRESLHGLGCIWFNLQKNLLVEKVSLFSHIRGSPALWLSLVPVFSLVDNSSVLDISWRALCKPDICLYFSLNVSVYPVTSCNLQPWEHFGISCFPTMFTGKWQRQVPDAHSFVPGWCSRRGCCNYSRSYLWILASGVLWASLFCS